MTFDPFIDKVQIEETEYDYDHWDEDEIIDSLNSLDNYMDDAEVLASAGWGTDEDYGMMNCDDY
jgi:hypothetical protein